MKSKSNRIWDYERWNILQVKALFNKTYKGKHSIYGNRLQSNNKPIFKLKKEVNNSN